MSDSPQDRSLMLALALVVLGLSAWWLVRRFSAVVPEPQPAEVAAVPSSQPVAAVAKPLPIPAPASVPSSAPAEKEARHDAPDRDALLSVIKSARPKTSRCFQAHLRKHARASGTVVMRITIAPSGAVSSAAVASSTLDDGAAFETCLVKTFEKLHFAVPPGGDDIVLKLPLVFSAAHQNR